ncbi:MAG: hypothetical protein WCI37_00155 [bacterium]
MRVRVFKIWQIVKFYLFKSLKKIHKSLKHTSNYISHYTSPIFAKVSKSYRQYIHPYLYPIYRRTLGPIIKFVLKFISHIYKKIRRLLKSHKFKAHARFFKLGFEAVILVAVIVGGYKYITRPNYNISSSAQKIIGTPDISLASKFVSYSKADKSYYLNKKAIGQKAMPNTIQVGSNSQATYSYKAPVDISRSEMTFYDNTNNLSFSITPSFKTASGKYKNGEFIYPMSKGQQAVYSIKDNGVKEDIILNKNLGDKTSLDFKLNLPDTLSAKLMPSGAVGIYSASPMLLGNVSASSSSDQALLKKARTISAKDTLQFVLMPPTVASSKNSDKEKERAKTKAQFALNGNNLTIKASGLSKLTYPISIDPTVVVKSALTSGNNESNANITSSSITTNSLTGGSLNGSSYNTGTITQSTNTITGSGTTFTSAMTGGTIFYSDGTNAIVTFNSATSLTSSVSKNFSAGSSYTIMNPWTTNSTTFTNPRANLAASVYNGYMYIIGGQTNSSVTNCTTGSVTTYYCNDVQYALICTGSNSGTGGCSSTAGSLGTWTTNSTTFTTPRSNLAASVYNGYIYIAGGWNGTTYYNDIQYATVNMNGSIGSFASASNTISYAASGVAGVGLSIYNNNLYIAGGFNGATNYNNVIYFNINTKNGDLSSSAINTTTLPLIQNNLNLVVYSGYIYAYGGTNPHIFGASDNLYTTFAQINADGSIGTWQVTSTATNASSHIKYSAGIAYNGYLYSFGGTNASATIGSTYYVKISDPGSINAFSSATGPGSLFMPAVTVYQNYLYVIGGCNLASTVNRWCSASTNVATTIYYSKINSNDGTLSAPSCGSPVGVWCLSPNVLSVGVFGASAIGYNSTIYVSTGCKDTGVVNNQPCSTVMNNFQYFLANTTDGSPGSVTNNTAAQLSGVFSGTFGSGLAISNGYLIVAGGCISNSNAAQYMCGRSVGALVSGIVYYQLLPTGGGALSAFTQSNYTTYGVFAPAVAAYNGYLYVAGGCAGNNLTTAGKGCSASGAAYNYLQYAKVSDIVNPSSPATPFLNDTSHAMPSFFAGGMSIYNGYIYVYGGCSDTTSSGSGITAGGYTGCGSSSVSPFTANVLNTVYAAPINLSNGAPSSNFVSVGTMANKSWGFGSAMSNGTIYMIGGCSTYASTTGGACASPATFSSNYQLATINLGGNGTLKAPTNCASTITNSFCDSGVALGSSASHTITGVSSTAYNGFLYEVGGTDSLTGDTTRCLFTSVSTTSLPYLANGGTYCNTVRVYSITSPNPVYIASYPMRFAKTGATVSAYNGYIYVTGGNSCTYAGCIQFNDVQVAKINIDGSLGAFSNTTPVSTWPVSGSQYACIQNSNTFCSSANGLICFYFGSGNCLLITTAGNNSYLNPGIDQSSISYSLGNVVYGSYYSEYYACKISTCSDNPSISTTNWLLLKNYNTSFNTSVCDSSHDCLGGLSSYSSNNTFINNSISFIDNGYLFVTNSTGSNSDYSVKINSDGTLSSTGQTLTSSGLAGSTSRAYYKGYEYVLGGTSLSSSLAYVQVSSGTYSSAWKLQSTNSRSLFDAYQLSNASLFASNGYLYVMGGESTITGASNACNNTTTSTTSCNFVAKAPIFSDGSLGDFQYAGTLPSITVTTNLGASVYNGYVYLPNPGTGVTDIWYSGLQSIAHNGIYSYLFNSLTSVTPYGLTVSGTSGKYDDLVTYKPMGDSANVCSGPPTNITPVLSSYNSIAMPTGNTCTNNKTTSQYYLLTVNINDSSVFTFSTYTPSNITGFTLFYHPNSGSRLHGGSDGASGSALPYTSGVQNLQVLDTPR